MRNSKNRSRGKSNRNNNRNNSGNNMNRVFDSSGPESRVRGTPQQIIDKYMQLANDATLSNDRVAAESFQQHAEHYTRLLSESQKVAEAKRVQAEQHNRDRQQREREEREARNARREQSGGDQGSERASERGGNQSNDPSNMPQPAAAPAQSDEGNQARDQDDSGLVETPESKPRKRAPRARKPRVKPVADTAKSDNNGSTETPEAAE